ncbi:MAG TPA: MFS transporter [Devosiaceae bacterium]|nr:MFS transporter [Devosiaceae bacterium]
MTVATTAPAAVDQSDGLPNPVRTLAFLTVALGIVMAVLDGTIVNVALPSIALDQHATAAESIWIVTGYQLAVVVALLPMSAIGEAVGFKKVFTAGLLIFGLASLLCAYSTSIPMLTSARILQGIGGAGLMSISTALVRFIMPSKHLGRGIAGIAMIVAVSGAAGPTIAAAILAVTTWHWLFLINVPLGVLGLLVGRFTLPQTPASGRRFDLASAALNALTLGPLISGLSSIGTTSIPWWVPAVQILLAVIAGVFFVRRQYALEVPMLPLDLLRIKPFRLSIIASVTSFSAQMLATVSLPFFFIHGLGYSDVETGLLMTPWPVATAIAAPISARLSERWSGARISGIGSLIFALGLASVAVLPAHAAIWDIVLRLAVTGAGFGLFQSPNNKVMFSSAPRNRSGGASGMQSTARLTGQSVGAAMAAIIFGLTASYNLGLSMGVAAVFAVAAAILSIWR